MTICCALVGEQGGWGGGGGKWVNGDWTGEAEGTIVNKDVEL